MGIQSVIKSDPHIIPGDADLVGGARVDDLDVPSVAVHDVAGDGGAVRRAGGVDGHGQPRHHHLPIGIN